MAMATCLLLFLFSLACVYSASDSQHRRFEYKQSFKGPHLCDQRGRVFFWSLGGHALASDDQVRITASLRSQKGWMWTKMKTTYKNWEVEITFRVSGRARVGADGLAFWYTAEVGQEGPVFGSSDMWDGLGVFFDSFDNDGQQNNPYILVMTNNRTVSYDHASDGAEQQLGGCLRDFRNRPHPVKAKIRYYKGTLSVYFNSGVVVSDEGYDLCVEKENVVLPDRGYFGLSAATGGLADDHDVIAFKTMSLEAPLPEDRKDEGEEPVTLSESELEKLNQEFEQYSKSFEEQKETYSKEHPDPYEGYGDKFLAESVEERNLNQIMQGQTDILTVVRDLSVKFEHLRDDVQRKSVPSGQAAVRPASHDPSDAMGTELHTLIQQQKTIMHKLEGIESLQRHQAASGQQQGGSSDLTAHVGSLIETVRNVQQSVDTLTTQVTNQGVQGQSPGVDASGCIPLIYFGLFVCGQVVMFIAYLVYKHKKDTAAKKFF